MDKLIKIKTILEKNNLPAIQLQADSDASGIEMDILHRFVEMLNNQEYVFNVMAFLSEELSVQHHQLPQEFHDKKELDIKEIPHAFKKEKVNIVIRFVEKNKITQK